MIITKYVLTKNNINQKQGFMKLHKRTCNSIFGTRHFDFFEVRTENWRTLRKAVIQYHNILPTSRLYRSHPYNIVYFSVFFFLLSCRARLLRTGITFSRVKYALRFSGNCVSSRRFSNVSLFPLGSSNFPRFAWLGSIFWERAFRASWKIARGKC